MDALPEAEGFKLTNPCQRARCPAFDTKFLLVSLDLGLVPRVLLACVMFFESFQSLVPLATSP